MSSQFEVICRQFRPEDQDAVGRLYFSGLHIYDHLPIVGETYAWYIRNRLEPTGDMSNVQSTYMSYGELKCFWVAELRGEIVGCVGAIPSTSTKFSEGYVELVRMIVSNSCRGMGIGTMLLRELETWAVRRGYSHVYLLTFSELAEPCALYRKCGFVLAEEEDFDVSDKVINQQDGPPVVKVAHFIKKIDTRGAEEL